MTYRSQPQPNDGLLGRLPSLSSSCLVTLPRPCLPPSLGAFLRCVALQQAQALVQHHDAVTGTSKQHVAEDYAQRLDKARVMAERAVSSWLGRLAFGSGRAGISPQEDASPELVQCRFANVSICDVTTEVGTG